MGFVPEKLWPLNLKTHILAYFIGDFPLFSGVHIANIINTKSAKMRAAWMLAIKSILNDSAR